MLFAHATGAVPEVTVQTRFTSAAVTSTRE